jgi:hypothetical protein
MTETFEHIKQRYGVNPRIGMEIIYKDQKGVIVEDMGCYIGVNFYNQKNTSVLPLHPTDNVIYTDKQGVIRPLTTSQKRYRHFRSLDSDMTFMQYLKLKIYHP